MSQDSSKVDITKAINNAWMTPVTAINPLNYRQINQSDKSMSTTKTSKVLLYEN